MEIAFALVNKGVLITSHSRSFQRGDGSLLSLHIAGALPL